MLYHQKYSPRRPYKIVCWYKGEFKSGIELTARKIQVPCGLQTLTIIEWMDDEGRVYAREVEN